MMASFTSEWVKLRRPAILLGTIGASLAFTILTTVLSFANPGDGSEGELGPGTQGTTLDDLAQADGLLYGLTSASEFLGIVALVVFSSAVATEYSHGTLRSLLVREPRRLRLLGGKLIALITLVIAAVLCTAPASALLALMLAPDSGVDTAGWTSADAIGSAIARTAESAAAMIGHGLLGAALALVLRSSVAAIGIGVAYLLPVESILSAALSGSERWLPGDLLSALANGGTDEVGLLHAAVTITLYLAVLGVVCGRLFATRDVTA